MTIDEMIEVLQAYKEGKTIQAREKGYTDWFDTNYPFFDFDNLEYRIKEQKIVPYETFDGTPCKKEVKG